METIVAPDPVKLTRTWLTGKYPWAVTVTKNRPSLLTGRTVTVRRNGGLRPDLVTDSAWLSVECFAPNDDDAAVLGHLTYALLHAMKGEVVGGVQCYQVQTLGGPADFPDAVAQQPRYVMSVSADFRATALV